MVRSALIISFLFICSNNLLAGSPQFGSTDLSLTCFYPGILQQHIDLDPYSNIPTFQHSYIPSLHHSTTPSLHHSLFPRQDSLHSSREIHDAEIDNGRMLLVGGALLGSMVTIHIYQENGWWKDNRAPFHFQEDLTYGLWVDKIGHFYDGAVLTFAIGKSLRWANVPEQTALWIGAGSSLLFQTYIEVEDGFSAWGFDRVDWLTDLGGAGWPLARHYVPFLQNFDLKLSYHPSDLLGGSAGIGFRGQQHLMMDDYEGQTFWLSAKVNNLLPRSIEPYWPDFLAVAVGYGARNIAEPNPHRVWFVAPDIDMTKVIPQTTGFLRAFSEALNFIRLPLPAVQVSPNGIVYGIYF